jgi:hypothetical protein
MNFISILLNLKRGLMFSAFISLSLSSLCQELYSAHGYWEESTKPSYLSIKKKDQVGDSLTTSQKLYLNDYETYLATYYSRMSDDEKGKYEAMKDKWQRQSSPVAQLQESNPYEGRKKNRFGSVLYGVYYGISLVKIAGVQGPAQVSVPLITGGLMLLGPVIRNRRYDNVTPNTIRLRNTGRLLGLGYGAALGLALTANSDNNVKWVLGLSSLGSIGLSEYAFHLQEKKNFSLGHIDLMRHYSFLTSWATLSVLFAANTDNAHLTGAALLVGGVSGLFIGNSVAKKYDYTRGDVDAISSLSIISTGLGFTGVIQALDNNNDQAGLILLPSAASIAGTIWGQRTVRGAHLSDKQGTVINFSTSGAALIGLGITALTETKSPTAYVGIPSALALLTHQLLLHKFKMKNLEQTFQGSARKKFKTKVALQVSPENYLMGRMITNEKSIQQSTIRMQNPLATLKISF